VSVAKQIETKITTALEPHYLEVVNESFKHSVPPGSESHFKLVVVSDHFDGQARVRRHQTVNRILAAELRDCIHALSMETLTAAEWSARGGETLASPPCLGGSKAGS
jgi:BolA protein